MRPVLTDLQTIPALVARCTTNHPDQQAWFHKAHGKWTGITWQQYDERVKARALAFHELGVRKGQRVVLMFPNSLEWEICEKGLMCLGAIVVGVDTHASTHVKEHVLRDSAASVLIIQQPECAKDLHWSTFPSLKSIVTAEPLNSHHPTSQRTVFWNDLTNLHSSGDATTIEAVNAHDAATIIYTSGTSGEPRGILYTHYQFLLACQAILDAFPSFNRRDVTMCILPLSHLFQRIINACAMAVGGSTYFIDNPKHFQTDITSINPTVMVGVPRLYEKIHESVQSKLAVLPWGLGSLVPKSLIRRMIFGKRIRLLITGAASATPLIQNFYRELGIPLYEAYGLSENIIPVAMNTFELKKEGSVGKPLPQNTLRIEPDGEILLRGPSVFNGYWNDTTTRQYFTDDGFYRTADIGHLDEQGFLYLTGRKNDLIKTSTGRRIAPRAIEEKLQENCHVDIALVFGNNRKTLSTLIHCTTKLTETSMAMIRQHVEQVNQSMSAYEHISAVLVTDDEFNVENQCLTPSLKIRRAFIYEQYKQGIESLYEALEKPENHGTIVITSFNV